MASAPKKVLFAPKWYPNPDDPQLGIFIRKHALAVAEYCKVAVLHVTAVNDISSTEEVVIKEDGNLLEVSCYYSKSAGKLSKPFLYLKAFRKGKAIIDEKFGEPDLIHVHVMSKPAFAVRRYYAGTLYLISEHWSGYLTGAYDERNAIKKRYTKKAVAAAQCVTVVSEELQIAMQSKGLKSNYHIVPNVIEAAEATTIPTTDKTIMLSVADLDDNIKNISDVIKTVAELPSELQLEYYIIGDGPDADQLKLLASDLEILDKSVFFKGRLPNNEVLDYMHQVHFVVVNSRKETFGVIAAEAMLSGKPVIASRCGGPELFVNDSNGILIDVDQPDQLKEAIISMAKNHATYDLLSTQRSLEEKYSRMAVGQQFYDIYIQILNAVS